MNDGVEGLPEVGGGCACFLVPERYWTTYGSAVDPATQVEWNPECPEHQPCSICGHFGCSECGCTGCAETIAMGAR